MPGEQTPSAWRIGIVPILTFAITLGTAYGITQFESGLAKAEREAFQSRMQALEQWSIRTEGNRYTSREGDAVEKELRSHEKADWHNRAGEAISRINAIMLTLQSRLERIELDHAQFKKRTEVEVEKK